MKVLIPSISKQISNEKVFNSISRNYSQLTKFWFNFQIQWMQRSYQSFKDHDKYLIFIHLVHKTLIFYSNNFIKLDFDTYYSKKQLEIPNFNIVSISKDLKISKETARRKILELEKIGAIVRDKKKIILNRSAFKFQIPNKSVTEAAFLLSKFTEILSKNKDIDKKLNSEEIEFYFRKNFTYCWKIFFDMQIQLVVHWKKVFTDIETWHIWGIIATQKNFKTQDNQILDREKWLKDTLEESTKGINAMSVAELSGIPRATVVRKINILIRKKMISIDKKKLFTPNNTSLKKISESNKQATYLISCFVCQIINLMQTR